MRKILFALLGLMLVFGSANAVWANSTYSYCRDISTLTEFNGVTILNEPVNRGKGVSVDTSGWANKPHINGFAIYDQPCENGGNVVDTELLYNTTTGNQIDTAAFLFMVNLTPSQSTNYSLYYSTTDVGKPLPQTTDLATSIVSGNYVINASTDIGGQIGLAKGGILSMTYQGFEYGQPSYPALATAYGNSTGDYFSYPAGSIIGTVTCTNTYDGLLKKTVTCSNTATTAKLIYNIYRGTKFIEIVYANGEGDWGMRQDFHDSSRFRYYDNFDNPTNSSEVGTTNAHSTRGVVSIRHYEPTYPTVPIIVTWNNTNGHNAFYTDCCSGGNVQFSLWTFNAPTTRKQNETKEVRYNFVAQADLGDATTSASMLSTSKAFNESIGSTATFGDEQEPNQLPQFSGQTPANGATFAYGSPVTISADWTDDVGLTEFVFETNVTGSLANLTVPASGASNSSAFAFNGLAQGAYIWRIYASDGTGYNATPQREFTVLAAPQPRFYQNIELAEGIGFTGNVILKGVAQIGAGTLDESLNPNNGFLEILALVTTLLGALLVVAYTKSLSKTV